jgi:DNA modification methylase
MAAKYAKWPQNRPSGRKVYQLLPWQVPPKFTQIWIFGLKICHLATLLWNKKNPP